jgi:hypothetical protein
MFTLYFSTLSWFVLHFGPCGLALAYTIPAVALMVALAIISKVSGKNI